MSCRVLKRDMEIAMLDAIVERAKSRGIRSIVGYFIPSAKNAMVKEFYSVMGFSPIAPGNPSQILTSSAPGSETTMWELDLADYTPQNTHIKVLEYAHA